MAIKIEAEAGAIEQNGEGKAEVKERVQRVRIGLTGLAFVFVLVLIGAAITNWSTDPPPTNQVIANAIPSEPNEPLAEIGAAPGDSSAANAVTNDHR